MSIVKTVEISWSKTVEEFEKARTNGEAWIWTEDTLRLIFFRHFCQIDRSMEIEEVTNFLKTKLARKHIPKIPLRML